MSVLFIVYIVVGSKNKNNNVGEYNCVHIHKAAMKWLLMPNLMIHLYCKVENADKG